MDVEQLFCPARGWLIHGTVVGVSAYQSRNPGNLRQNGVDVLVLGIFVAGATSPEFGFTRMSGWTTSASAKIGDSRGAP